MTEHMKQTSKPDSNSTSTTTIPQSLDTFPSSMEMLTPDNIISLQGVIGNRAVQRLLLQRDPDPTVADAAVPEVVDNPMSPGQVVKARGFYAGRPDLYTPQIISQIQAEVGAPVTGAVTEEMIQAVARFQRDEGTLAVDGMAGPRTLPAAFPTGLAADANEEQYAEDVETFQADWGALTTPEARIEKIIKTVNERLAASKVHPVSHEFADTGAATAQFDFTTWKVQIGKSHFEGDTISDQEMTSLAGTVYHEARHAEQWYRIAQMLAGKKRTAAQIATETAIEVGAVAAAVAEPIQPGTMEAVIATGWYDSIYGRDSAKREAVLTEVLAAKTAAVKAKKERDANPTPANEAKFFKAKARFDKAFKAYKNLPEEADAHRVGDETELLVSDELTD